MLKDFELKTYICHYSPLKERMDNILSQVNKSNLIRYGFQIINSEPDDDFISNFYDKSRSEWRKKVDCMEYGGFIFSRLLRKSEMSLLYKHIEILKIISNSDAEVSLVLEDDVILDDDFDNKLLDVISDSDDDWDFIFLGNGCGLRIPESDRIKGRFSYIKKSPSSKCTDSFLIKKKSALKIINQFAKFSLPIDFEFNYYMYKNDMKVYWAEPPIVKQGSQDSTFFSSTKL